MARTALEDVADSRIYKGIIVAGMVVAIIFFFVAMYFLFKLIGTLIFGTFSYVKEGVEQSGYSAGSFFSVPTVRVPYELE